MRLLSFTLGYMTTVIGVQLIMGAAIAADDYWVCVSNERSDNVTILNGDDLSQISTIDVGKRPRGIHASPDGRRLYMALSGTPMSGPPKLDAAGNPIFEEDRWDEADHSADGIGVVDLETMRFVTKLPSGSDPEEFAISADGRRLYISNEDVATATVLNVETEEPEALVRVKREPEGVALSPDGQFVYVTCETAGEIVVIDTETNKPIAEFIVGVRPRTVAFAPNRPRAFIPSETQAQVSVVDTEHHEVIRTIALPDGSRPMGTAISDDGKTLYITNGRAGTLSIVDTDGEVIRTLSIGKRPWGVAISPDGQRLFAADGPSDEVVVVDLSSQQVEKRIAVGKGPWGVAIVERPMRLSDP